MLTTTIVTIFVIILIFIGARTLVISNKEIAYKQAIHTAQLERNSITVEDKDNTAYDILANIIYSTVKDRQDWLLTFKVLEKVIPDTIIDKKEAYYVWTTFLRQGERVGVPYRDQRKVVKYISDNN